MSERIFLNLGCGGNILPHPWKNRDAELDIFKRLPFDDGVIDFILAEHVTEHGTPQEAWGFFEECFRVLKPGGVVRICVPDVDRIRSYCNEAYRNAVRNGGHGENPIKAAIFCHGHKSAWTQELLEVFLDSVGFTTTIESYGKSNHHELRGVEGHGRAVGEEVAIIETAIVEGMK